MTHHPNIVALNNRHLFLQVGNLSSPSSGGRNSSVKGWQGCAPSRGAGGGSFQLPGPQEALAHGHVTLLSSCMWSFPLLTVSPPPLPLKNLSLGLGPTESAGASVVAQRVKTLPVMRETWVRSLDQEDHLEEEMATHSSVLAWRIPWTEEPGGLYSSWGRKELDTTEHSTSTFSL